MKLKAPFPAFGGKSAVAEVVWGRLGDCDNFIEPFFNSGAVLLLRPHAPKIETANDLDSYIANFWRATQQDPEAVAYYADGPVNEVDLHSRHRWLVLSDDAATFRKRMRTEPDYYDSKVAGYWCWGLCCWIGSGWCATNESAEWDQMPDITGARDIGKGVHARGQDNRKPRIDGGEGQLGHGVHAKGQLPKLSCSDGVLGTTSEQLPLIGDPPRGGHRGAGPAGESLPVKRQRLTGSNKILGQVGSLHGKRPNLNGTPDGAVSNAGVPCTPALLTAGNRPQLADAFSRGRGVNGNDEAGTCEQRRAWLLDWFCRLRDRLRTVRVCCGDWSRVCSSESVTTRLGTTGVFLDPPYGAKAKRTKKLYSTDSLTVADDVRRWCLERGPDPMMRISLAGYAGEGHEELEQHGWDVFAWKAAGGYGNRTEEGKANSAKERLWFSPHCLSGCPLFED